MENQTKKMSLGDCITLKSLLLTQADFQQRITGMQLPTDDVKWFSYHMQGMLEELGELLKADKRWKTHRNDSVDVENKLEELADVFVTTFNLAIFSGFSHDEVIDAIVDKMQVNNIRLASESKYIK